MSSTISRNDDIISTKLDDEIVLMSVEQGNYYGLKTTSRRIWELLESPQDLESLCRSLHQEYDAPMETLEHDVREFVQEMVRQSLLIVS